jgi:hypothetical protein
MGGSFGPIALVDLFDGGHHRSYLNMYAMALAEEHIEVYALSTFPLDIPENLRTLVHHIYIDKNSLLGDNKSICAVIFFFRRLARILDDIEELRFVFFMYTSIPGLNRIPGRLLDLFFPYPWGALNMHPILGTPKRSIDQKLRLRLCGERGIAERYITSRKMKFLAFLSELVVDHYKSVYPQKNFEWLPDVARFQPHLPLGEIAEEMKRKAGGRKIVTLAGSLEYRKGTSLLMHLAMNADPSKFYFSFCGEPAWHTFPDRGRLFQEFMAQGAENCFFYMKYIEDDDEFN